VHGGDADAGGRAADADGVDLIGAFELERKCSARARAARLPRTTAARRL
jgi:hypothetical protein